LRLATAYAEKLHQGLLKPDDSQRQLVQKLAELQNKLEHKGGGFWNRMFGPHIATHGIYIHGKVGRGKTMLMDLFYDNISNVPKRRVHFHAFMQEVHATRSKLKSADLIGDIATSIASTAKLLCLDEMQITDIADAMIIGRLFEALQRRDVCFVTTSNLPPEELYKDGLNRQLFLPFIAKLRESLDVVSLDSPRDYRLGRVTARETYIIPLGQDSTARVNSLWDDLTDGDQGEPDDLTVLGRKLHVPRAARGCARFSFADLCENSLGPPDYLAITNSFQTVFIDNIPVLKASQRNEAKRFVLMIDVFYDAGTRLVVSAAAPPELLYPKGTHSTEFQRTISRLKEMQSASWWQSNASLDAAPQQR
jgi:cell division protein ZapE